jgi:hypothetical protein
MFLFGPFLEGCRNMLTVTHKCTEYAMCTQNKDLQSTFDFLSHKIKTYKVPLFLQVHTQWLKTNCTMASKGSVAHLFCLIYGETNISNKHLRVEPSRRLRTLSYATATMIQLTSFRFGLYCCAVQPSTNHRTAWIWVIKTLLGQGNRPFLEQGGLAFRCSVVLLVSSASAWIQNDAKNNEGQGSSAVWLLESNCKWAVQNSGIEAVHNATLVSIQPHYLVNSSCSYRQWLMDTMLQCV